MERRTDSKKRDKKQMYKQKFASSKRNEEIKRGLAGFLVTCEGNKEKRCIKEVFNVLNEFVEKVYPDLDLKTLLKDHVEKEDENVTKQKVESLDDELKQLKHGKKIWYTFDMQTPGVLFIKLIDQMRPHINVIRLMEAILSHIAEGNIVTRFACRMIPVHSL